MPSTKDLNEKASIFYPQFWFQLLSVTLLGVLSAYVYMYLGNSIKENFEGFSAWMIPAYLFSYSLYSRATDYFRFTHRTGIFNLSTVAQPYLFLITAVGIFWGFQVLNTGSLFFSLILSCFITGGLMLLMIVKEINLDFRKFRFNELSEEMKVGFPLVLVYLVDIVLSCGDRYIIAAMLSIRDVGIYVPAYQLGMLVMVVPKVFGIVLHPIVALCIDNDDADKAKRYFDNSVNIFLICSIPYIFGAVILGKEILILYTNAEVAEASWIVIPVAATASIFYGLTLIKAIILLARLIYALFYINVICAAVNIILNLILIKLFGNVIVVSLATLFSYLLSYILLSQKIKTDPINSSFDWKGIIHILISSGVMAVALQLILFSEVLKFLDFFKLTLLFFIAVALYFSLTFSRYSNRVGFCKLVKSLGYK